ncbi:putative glutamyl-tRNA amidotransferase subunit A [Xylaria sp. FL1042]|nr:putative glutamyl-tRNA amidotransferase subunit A [Xylaria sp. FL1042]
MTIEYNGYLKAVLSTSSEESVLRIARGVDHEQFSGKTRGPLHGIPIILKDNIATNSELRMETTVGTYALVGSRVGIVAPLSRRLQDAGAVLIGRGNLSIAVGGLTQTPYAAGGKLRNDGFGEHSSSSRSCVAVAAGLVPPTLGLISQEGVCQISSEFDSAGPIARDPGDITVLLDAVADPLQNTNMIPAGGYLDRLTGTSGGIRIGVPDPQKWHLPAAVAVPNPDVERQQERNILNAYETLRKAGAYVKNVEIAPLSGLEVDGMNLIARAMNSGFKPEFEAYLQNLEVSKVRTLDDVVHFMRDHADLELPKESPNLVRLENTACQAIDHCLEQHGVDVILGPADSEIDDYYTAAGTLVQLMSAWETLFGERRRIPTCPMDHPKSELW